MLRAEAADRYSELIGDPSVSHPETLPGNQHVWHLYVTQVTDRDRILARLNAAGVGAGIHYPVPIHLQGAYSDLGKGVGSFPNTEHLANHALSLPMYPGITAEDQLHVAEYLNSAVEHGG